MKNLIRKLTSRKLWIAIIGFVSALGVIFGIDEIRVEQICALIGALGTLVAYIFAEAITDAKCQNSDTKEHLGEKVEPSAHSEDDKA